MEPGVYALMRVCVMQCSRPVLPVSVSLHVRMYAYTHRTCAGPLIHNKHSTTNPLPPVPTYRMTLEYDGAAYHGWQIQKNVETVQGALQEALAVILDDPVTVNGSSRTDAGVHARGQVAHIRSEAAVDPYRLKGSLNGVLPSTVAVRTVEETHPEFHARFHARGRRYHYYISPEPIAIERNIRLFVRPPRPDFERMNRAVEALTGSRTCASFCLTSPSTDHYICRVEHARWIQEDHPDNWRFEIEANRFLHGMVRAIVGTLLEIGQKKRPPEDFERVIRAENREAAGPSVPARGLVLENVYY